ncbi:DUF4202 domain-containing protein [Rubritalea tangerina]|uniref:DUF4202 domain-containing protein n=1 Tax=Rubritalea tangerina TaxID=430798 RepID=A0ABW4ZEI7_9BACT
MEKETLFELAIEKVDAANAMDPRMWVYEGKSYPQELFFSEQHTKWVLELDADASEALLLASRTQHVCRWEIPRKSYPMDRTGYLTWRSDLKKFHAQRAGEILTQVGYGSEMVERVQALNLKKNMRKDTECQMLEDALCLTFMEHQFDDLIASTEEGKMIKIVQKTWGKMSEQGRERALQLDLSESALSVVKKALEAA